MSENDQEHAEQVKLARECGYSDTYFDGVASDLPCHCAECRKAYAEGMNQAVSDMLTEGMIK